MKASVDQLRKHGFKVRITHARRLRAPMIVPQSEKYPDGLDFCGSKYEYENSNKSADVPWGKNILAHGGFTFAEIICPDGHVSKGKYNFRNEHYNRRVGRNIALGLALKAAGEHANLNELAHA